MAKIALMDVDGHNGYPNLALMKIAAWHKSVGDVVDWYHPFDRFDRLYMSKVFNFTPDYAYHITNVDGPIIRGGTGYDITSRLHHFIDVMQPDYSIYPQIDSRTSYGFLTRGCTNRCKWCVVPRKEGDIYPYMDIDEITQNGARPYAVLMDNNVLASDYGLQQIEKIAARGYHVDFNQALDARLVTPEIAHNLARCKWIDRRIRFGCDTTRQIAECERAIGLLRSAGYRGDFLLYCIIIDFEESFARINHWRLKHDRGITPFAQPYRDPDKPHHIIPQWQKDLARWTNEKQTFKVTDFKNFSPRKGFTCDSYFK